MNLFATYSDLRRLSAEVDGRVLLEKAASKAETKTVFLSHSSKDNDLLPGVISVLEANGGRVYADVGDPELPKSDFTEVADRLRSAVRLCARFVLLVTPRTKDSVWIPWELGLGDGVHGDPHVALFPSAESSTEKEWSEREFLGLYQRIIWGNFEGKQPEWLVFNHLTNTAMPLRAWLN